MSLGIPVGERIEERWECKWAMGGDRTLVEEQGDEEWNPEALQIQKNPKHQFVGCLMRPNSV